MSKATRVEKYWEMVEVKTESSAKKVAEKFRLKFATYILTREPGAEEQRIAMRADGCVILRDVTMGDGAWGHFVFHV